MEADLTGSKLPLHLQSPDVGRCGIARVATFEAKDA
jgi:hypothetical protein